MGSLRLARIWEPSRRGAFGARCFEPTGLEPPACVISAACRTYFPNARYLPHCGRIPGLMLTPCLRGAGQLETYLEENCDCGGCNACHGGCRWRGRPSASAARLSNGSGRQDADWQVTDREESNRQRARCRTLLIGLAESGRFRRQWKDDDACLTGRRGWDGASLGHWHWLFCFRAISNQLPQTRATPALGRIAPFPRRSTSALLTPMRLLPVRRRTNRNQFEGRGRNPPRDHITSISEPERRRAGDTPSSGMGRQASDRLKSRVLPQRETHWLMSSVM